MLVRFPPQRTISDLSWNGILPAAEGSGIYKASKPICCEKDHFFHSFLGGLLLSRERCSMSKSNISVDWWSILPFDLLPCFTSYHPIKIMKYDPQEIDRNVDLSSHPTIRWQDFLRTFKILGGFWYGSMILSNGLFLLLLRCEMYNSPQNYLWQCYALCGFCGCHGYTVNIGNCKEIHMINAANSCACSPAT